MNAETMLEDEETPPAYEDAKVAEAAKSEQGADEPKAPGTKTSANATNVEQPVVTQQVRINSWGRWRVKYAQWVVFARLEF